MRQYILTVTEKQIITKFLETGDKLEGFRVLLHRCKRLQTINQDLELVKQFLKKASE
jgi:hypothetical protein